MTKHSEPSAELPTVVLHVTTSLNMGGAQVMLRKLVEHGSETPGPLRHSIVSLLSPGVMAPDTVRGDCAVYSLDMRRGLPSLRGLMRLLRISNYRRPDLMQGWMYHGNLAATVSAMTQARTLPVIWNVRHSLSDPGLESRTTRAILALSARLSHRTAAIVYNSRVAARQHEAIGFSPERTVYIPNGFDCEAFRPDRTRRELLRARFGIGHKGIVVGMVARHHPMKDHANLVRAVAAARRAGHDLHLLLVGTGLDAPPADLAEALRAEQIPEDRMTLVGERDDVAEWLPGLDIVALSSAWGEAFPNIIGEAMACGVPCVATDVGDNSDILKEGGMVVPPGNSEALAAALGKLASAGPDTRARLGELGRRRALEHYELGEIARRYRHLYSDVLRPGAESQTPAPSERQSSPTATAA